MRILICEDDPLQLDWLVCRLKDEDTFVQTAQQGDQAFAQWQSGRPWDFVLTDFCFLPGDKIKNGLELVRAICGFDPSQRIIVQTGDRNLIVPPRVKLLRKPYSFGRLVRTMQGMQALAPLPLFRGTKPAGAKDKQGKQGLTGS